MLAPHQYAIPQGSLIVVTGANGYIGSHVVNILLQLGYKVQDICFESEYGEGRFEAVVIPELGDAAAWEGKLDDVAGVVHLAFDLSFAAAVADIIPHAKNSILHLLDATRKQDAVKRFVLTSSALHWNEISVKAAWDSSTPPIKQGFHAYVAAKVEQEKVAWEWYGRILHPEVFGSSIRLVRKLLEGDDLIMRLFSPQWFVNVEDAARLHVIALLHPTVKDERIFAFASPKLRHENNRIPNPPENEGHDLSDVVPNGWKGLEESLADGIVDLE
ncbi:hypothetical protein BJY04DRAFT_205231 [Aspergillus karnatakaensis]|uniref:uncharacterized protein n=1 Tax=Aspergillus karnatakaensis TaxID=1810916 RepID=UPI003CCD0ABD